MTSKKRYKNLYINKKWMWRNKETGIIVEYFVLKYILLTKTLFLMVQFRILCTSKGKEHVCY